MEKVDYSILATEMQFTRVTAHLVKKSTTDGFVQFLDRVPIGTEFIIYPSIVQTFRLQHHITNEIKSHTMVWADGNEDAGEGWVPIECINWAGKSQVLRFASVIL